MLAAISYEAAADSFRLPDLVRPEHYDLALAPAADLRSFRGHERIDLQVRQSTTRIQLNAVELAFERVGVAPRSNAATVRARDAQQAVDIVLDL